MQSDNEILFDEIHITVYADKLWNADGENDYNAIELHMLKQIREVLEMVQLPDGFRMEVSI